MTDLGLFDRQRILEDISSTQELIDRLTYLIGLETNPTKKATIMSTVASLRTTLATLNGYLA
jgi:hypothetical protein